MKKLAPLLFLFFLCRFIQAQEVALGGWQTHFSYLSAFRVEQVQDRFFCATYNGLFSYQPQNDSTLLYSKINGLHDTGISSLAYEPDSRLLLLSYRNGNLDMVQLDENAELQQITEWPLLRDAPSLPVNRRSNQLVFRDKLAYLSTPFGIVVLDPVAREVHETYRNIGKGGSEVAVFGVSFTQDSLYAHTSQGMLRTSLSATVNRQFYGNWQTIPTPFAVSSIAVLQEKLYAGVAGQGIFRKSNAVWQLVYPATSQRVSLRVTQDRIVAALDNRVVTLSPQDQATGFRDPSLVAPQEAILDAANNLWVADRRTGLVSNFSGSYRSASPASGDTTIMNRTDSVVVDHNGLQWIRLPGTLGGGILVKGSTASQQRYLTTSPNNGGLPSSQINSLTLDRNGLVWFAADRGVGYFLPDGVLSTGAVNAIFPIFGQRKLLSNEYSTAIVTEPGDRKWVGTRNGLYLFSPDGTRLIRQFTRKDSPLPSDQILALRFDETSGRLYIDTPNGMVSYRSDASAPAADLQATTIFPNPVRPGYAGTVGIKGLVEGTVVKITDLAGRLVFETHSEGGTASWNLLDYTGRRARGGVYLVLTIAPDGTESKAGKLAIVE
jgi:ligand-binding sensor domain-containing protein